MRQHDDAIVGFALLEIGRQPGELCVAQPGARIGNIVEHDEMHALVVERVMRRAEEFPVGLAGVERGIVLARHEAHVFYAQRQNDLAEALHAGAALLRVIGRVGKIAGEDDEVRRVGEAVHGRHRPTCCARASSATCARP